MERNRFVFVLFVVFTLICLPVYASWFGRDAQPGTKGFFWYEVVENNATNATNATNQTMSMPEPEKPKPREEAKREEKSKYPTDVKIPWDRVWTMHPKEFQKLIDEVQDLAVMDPTNKQRVRELYALQAVASIRAKRFQEAVSEVRREMPGLDMSVKRSPTLIGSMAEASQRIQERQEIVPFMRDNMGLVFFYSPSCVYCEKEKYILQAFQKKWQWNKITYVNIYKDTDAKLKFDVQVTPDLWIVGKVGDEIKERRLKAGLATMADIELGLIKAYYEWFEGKNYDRPNMVEELVKPEEIIKQFHQRNN